MNKSGHMKTRAILRITGQLLITLLIALRRGSEPHSFRVVGNGLPSDVELIRAFVDPTTDDVLMVLASEHFDIAPDASMHISGYPYLAPVECQVFYTEETATAEGQES